jgi:hypothetical protein
MSSVKEAPVSNEQQTVVKETIEVSMKGKWFAVPSLRVDGKNIVVQGNHVRLAGIHEEEWLPTEVEDPKRCIQLLKDQGNPDLRADIFSFCQKLPATQQKYDYPVEWDSIAAIPITNFKEWWEGLPQESRKNVRRAEKRGVIVTVKPLDSRLVQHLIDLNNDSPMRQGKPFTHFGKTYDQVWKDQQSFLDRSQYICAYAGEELVGIVKLVYRGNVASILTSVSRKSQQDKRPANALMAKVIEICVTEGMSHLVFGKYNYGNKKDTPLREFKVRNGFQEFLVPHYYVPLNLKGALIVKLKLYRGLIGLLPHPVIAMLVAARAKWQQRKMSRCSSMPERPTRNRQMGRSIPPAGSNS